MPQENIDFTILYKAVNCTTYIFSAVALVRKLARVERRTHMQGCTGEKTQCPCPLSKYWVTCERHYRGRAVTSSETLPISLPVNEVIVKLQPHNRQHWMILPARQD